jgi:hypothetical protein
MPRKKEIPSITRRTGELRKALKKAELLAFEVLLRGGLVPDFPPVRGLPRSAAEKKLSVRASRAFPLIRQARRELGDLKDD